MIFQLLLLLSHLNVVQGGSMRAHLSDSLQLKCDTLPYRTNYAVDGCYFAVLEKIEFAKASEMCSDVFFGAKAVAKPLDAVFKSMMVDKTEFHRGSYSKGEKFIICSYVNDYKCDVDQAMLLTGRCLIRADKKMNFNDAESHCNEHGMEIPAPSNDLDNRIVRDVLVKELVWLNNNANRNGKNHLRWSACEKSSGKHQLLKGADQSCDKKFSTVIDKDGYWSKADVTKKMDVVCTKSAVNDFFKGAANIKPTCNYHDSTDKVKTLNSNFSSAGCMANTKTCYTPTSSSISYNVLGRATVETRRGCEAFCDSQSKCGAFSFKEAGLSSSCVLLYAGSENAKCENQTTIFVKKTTGCVGRTDIFAEFGVDPCIDSYHPIRGRQPVCDQDAQKHYFIRAVTACGRRVDLNTHTASLIVPSDGMWEYIQPDNLIKVKIVAAVCAASGSTKCACPQLQQVTVPGRYSYAVVPNRQNPCQNGHQMFFKDENIKELVEVQLVHTASHAIVCKAGSWVVADVGWGHSNMVITGAACVY